MVVKDLTGDTNTFDLEVAEEKSWASVECDIRCRGKQTMTK